MPSSAGKQPSATDSKWPAPDVRERQLFGVSMRTAGFRRGDRKVRDPQSTHRGRSTVSSETWKRTYAVDHSSASNATLVGDRYPVPSVRSCAARMLAKTMRGVGLLGRSPLPHRANSDAASRGLPTFMASLSAQHPSETETARRQSRFRGRVSWAEKMESMPLSEPC